MIALLAAATIPTPSPAQLRYMATDFIALIHFNMGTFAHNGDPADDGEGRHDGDFSACAGEDAWVAWGAAAQIAEIAAQLSRRGAVRRSCCSGGCRPVELAV